jgi:hypothetical protein
VAGEEVKSKFDFYKWEVRMRSGKLRLGAVTLLILCIVLFGILVTSLTANAQPEYPFMGTWCGGSSYTCLYITRPQDTVSVELGFGGRTDRIPCTNITRSEADELNADCDNMTISTKAGDNDSEVTLHLRWINYGEDRELNRVPD